MLDEEYLHSDHMCNSLHLEMAVLGVGTQADQGIDHSMGPVGLTEGYVDSFGSADACTLGLKAYEGTAAGLRVHMVAEQVSAPGGDMLVFHNSWDDKERQRPAVDLGREQELYLAVVA